MSRPIIGIHLDIEPANNMFDSPFYALRDDYFKAVYQSGGLPIAIPHHLESAHEYIEKIDGLLIPGGCFEFPEEWYINEEISAPYEYKDRLKNDIKLIELALKKDLPILGICAGMQILACLEGAKMTRSITSQFQTDINHWDGAAKTKIGHYVDVKSGSLLDKIVSDKQIGANSHHREAVIEVPKNMVASGIATDGVIEAIEIADKKFALGIQWHPEYLVTNSDKAIFNHFIKASKS